MRESPVRAALGVLAIALGATAAPATVLTVDITADELDGGCVAGDCSLREAIADAVNGDTIAFALPGSPPWTIRLQAGLGQLVVDQVLTITGPGTADLAVSGDEDADGTGDLRVLRVLAAADLSITGLTLRDGRATLSSDRDGGCVQNLGDLTLSGVQLEACRAWDGGTSGFSGLPGGEGGAIRNAAGASLTVDLSSMVGNRAGKGDIGPGGDTAGRGGRGGAIANLGVLTVRRTSLSGNAAGDGGDPNGDGGEGGAIANLTGGTLLLEDSTVDGNHSGDGRAVAFGTGTDGRGGGLYLQGDATLNNVTLSGNSTGVVSTGNNVGGGAINVFGGTTRLRNATMTGNTARASGGGVSRAGGTVRLRNSLIAGNTSVATANEDCFTSAAASFVSEGYNLLGARDGCASSLVATDQRGTSASPLDPLVDPLGDYGGPTWTHALQPASPAIDLADPAGCMAWDPVSGTDVLMTADQRGEPRPVDGDGDGDPVCDVGSFEAPFLDSLPFLDGFETGDTSRWSATQP